VTGGDKRSFAQDFFFELMRDSQRLRAVYLAERERWIRSLDISGREEILFELEMLLRGIDRFFNLRNLFGETLERLCPDFQRQKGYEIPAPGQANMSMSTTQLSERFGCVSMTLEMPFKDNFDLPDEIYGWSPQRSKYLGYACLDALRGILPALKAASAERDNARREKVSA